jgi:hypothetical protein
LRRRVLAALKAPSPGQKRSPILSGGRFLSTGSYRLKVSQELK